MCSYGVFIFYYDEFDQNIHPSWGFLKLPRDVANMSELFFLHNLMKLSLQSFNTFLERNSACGVLLQNHLFESF